MGSYGAGRDRTQGCERGGYWEGRVRRLRKKARKSLPKPPLRGNNNAAAVCVTRGHQGPDRCNKTRGFRLQGSHVPSHEDTSEDPGFAPTYTEGNVALLPTDGTAVILFSRRLPGSAPRRRRFVSGAGAFRVEARNRRDASGGFMKRLQPSIGIAVARSRTCSSLPVGCAPRLCTPTVHSDCMLRPASRSERPVVHSAEPCAPRSFGGVTSPPSRGLPPPSLRLHPSPTPAAVTGNEGAQGRA